MKPIRLALIALLTATGLALAAAPADARNGGGHRGGYYHGGSHFRGGGWYGFPAFGLALGLGMSYPLWSYPYGGYYSPAPVYGYPAVVAPMPASPPVYIENNQTPPPNAPPPTTSAPPTVWWYWCGSAKAYYPYVDNCAEGWQRVPPQQ